MAALDPAVAACRVAVRGALAGLDPGARVLVGCSGGADSLALAAATAFEAPRLGLIAGSLTVDHRLQEGSAEVAARAAAQCRDLGLDPVRVEQVTVAERAGGPEAAARRARYAAFARAGSAVLLLAHTADDQAEQVLLGLVRGSGTRSLAGIPPRTTWTCEGGTARVRRPFLDCVTRAQTRAACRAQGIDWWEDPHNSDDRFARVRARRVLARLRDELGPGVDAGLARTARIARQDADLLDAMAARSADDLGEPPWDTASFASVPDAVRARVWRLLTTRAGATASDVGWVHVHQLDRLLTAWHGQGPVDVPGSLRVARVASRIEVTRRPVE